MTHRLHWLWLAGLVTGCTSESTSGDRNLPDRFEENLDVLMRSVSQPCGADTDSDGDGAFDMRTVYSYDAQGRSLRDTSTRLDGTPYQQTDYTWDNAGHMIDYNIDYPADGFRSNSRSIYDTIGRRLQFHSATYVDNAPYDRGVISYAEFDALGHSARGDEVIEDLSRGTSKTRIRSYGYDMLGRRISLDVRESDGSVFQSWTHVYDDDARTVTTTLVVPHTASGNPGFQDTRVDRYDNSNHYLGSHTVHTSLADGDSYTTDTIIEWNGDRQLSGRTTYGDSRYAPISYTYDYDCD